MSCGVNEWLDKKNVEGEGEGEGEGDDGTMGRWDDGMMGRWDDGTIVVIIFKVNYIIYIKSSFTSSWVWRISMICYVLAI